MAIIASLFALVGRFVGKILTTALGWSSLLLFGRVPQSKQILLAGITFGSLAWALAVFGVVFPRAGAYLIAAIPAPSWVDTAWIRLAMLIAALLIPIAVGVASRFMLDASERPRGRAAILGVLRGYPFAAVLSFVLVFVAVVAGIRRGRSLARRWQDGHVPVIVRAGGYERVVADLHAALGEAGLALDRTTAPRVLEIPAHLLAAVAGRGVRSLVPSRLALLRGDTVEILVYPSDIAISGTADELARARAAVATRLTFTAAYLTTTRDSQAIEDLIEEAAGVGASTHEPSRGGDAATAAAGRDRLSIRHREDVLAEVDRRLAMLNVPYDDWEVLYRMRLQVERDLLETPAAAAPAESPAGPAPQPEYGFSLVAAVAGFLVVLLDVVLALLERVSPSAPRR